MKYTTLILFIFFVFPVYSMEQFPKQQTNNNKTMVAMDTKQTLDVKKERMTKCAKKTATYCICASFVVGMTLLSMHLRLGMP